MIDAFPIRLQSEKQALAQIEADLRRARDDARRKKHPVTEADRAAWLALPQDIFQLDRLLAECQVLCCSSASKRNGVSKLVTLRARLSVGSCSTRLTGKQIASETAQILPRWKHRWQSCSVAVKEPAQSCKSKRENGWLPSKI